MWIDPPEYYDHPRGYITYTPYIPQHLITFFHNFTPPADRTLEQTDTEVLQKHFELINLQVTAPNPSPKTLKS